MLNDRVEHSLPEGWVWKTLQEVAKINGRDPEIRELPDDLPVTFVPMAAVDAMSGTIADPEVRPLKEVRKGFTPFSDGDVIIAKITPSMENGKAAIARNLVNGRGFGSTEFHVFRPKEEVLPEFLFHFIRQESFRKDAKAHFAGTAGQLRVPANFLYDYPIPLPPLPEQERIVARLEELLSDLEAGVAALKRVRLGVKRYKASVLKAACEGCLFNAVGTRRDGMNPVVGTGRDPSLQRREDDLPEGWRQVTLGTLLSEPLSNGKSVPNDVVGFPVLRLTALDNGRINLEERKIGKWTREKATRFLVKAGDFFVSRGNGSLRLVGRGALVEQEPDEVAYPDTLIRVRVSPEKCDIKYLRMVWDSQLIRSQIETTARTTAGIYKINQNDLNGFEFPLPPLEEQRRIVAEVERRLESARAVESAVELGLKRARRLRQAVLKAAFEGKL